MTAARLPWPFVVMLLSLPFVQVGTVPTPVRFILPDFIAIVLAAALLLEWRRTVEVLSRNGAVTAASAAAVLFCVTSAGASAISLLWITPGNFQQWVGYDNLLKWSGTPLERALIENVRVLQCVSAMIVTLALVNTSERLVQASRWYVIGATIAAAYGCYAWIAMVTESHLPLLPGTFSYVHLKRTAATFPEPAAYAGYALTGIALTGWTLERRPQEKWLVACLGVQLFAAVTSLSTLLLLGLALMWTASFVGRHRRQIATLTLASAMALLAVVAVMPRSVVVWAVEKPFTTHASWLDRATAWRAALAMTSEYPALGVGAGLYPYNQARFIAADSSVRYAGGRVNSPALEIAAESGLVGVAAITVLLFAAVIGASRAHHGFAGLRAVAVLLVLMAGYYTSRYSFLWVFVGLLVAGTTLRRDPSYSASAPPDLSCAS